ncbi:BlaI/MecI/CopY family transcriptional regulator [Ruminiclostridium cellobioparum]|uniref:Putative transcriptional regulator n=1 Tax=Ruminiclostridium cellobioparum subsp. termitidis CT1112 TaxID=1195236 RepID=S0FYI2_RUMCE|nr:BlaI/MecI/CopY family transcriptional regulator [Ruminiclostridium cellobioparum]EMS73658.1 putative transcriptional regulator [Ruminiclostridium cellobioparum subsp. termitidis CT1112]
MKIKLFDSELKVMEVLWREGNLTAGQLALVLKEETGWNRNTTYTVIKKCIDKGAIERLEPNFTCRALITQEEVQEQETAELINKMFSGSPELFFSTFINSKNFTKEQIDKLKQLVEKLK